MEIENLNVETLVPYARNAKLHDDAQIVDIANSIKEFGFNNPVLIDKDGGIIAGHGRVLAAKKLGMAELPCLRLSHLTDNQKRAYILADNRLAEKGGGWDENLLKMELESIDFSMFNDFKLDTLDFDISGLDIKEVEDIDSEPQIDKAAELAEKWGVKRGQLWQLGNHRILCGDSTNKEDVEKVMQGEKADAVLTDPPYGIGNLMHGGTWAKKQDVQFEKMRDWDEKTDQFFFDSIVSLSVPSIVWGGNYFSTIPSRCWLVWDKPEFPSTSSAELAWTNLDKNTKRFECNRTHQVDGAKEHATQKPIPLMKWCLEFLPEGIIYEPFSGSGTTLIACEQLGRKCRAIEISPAYVAVAIQRWVDSTGKEPKLISSTAMSTTTP